MHVVFMTTGMASSLNASLVFARRLEDDGKRISFLGPPEAEGAVQAAGFRYHALVEDRLLTRRWEQSSSATERDEIREQSLKNDEIETVISSIDAQLLLIDRELHYAIIATRGLDVPTLLTTSWFPPFRSWRVPPMNTRLRPPTGMWSTLQVAMSWERIWMRSWKAEVLSRIRRRLKRDPLRPVGYRAHDSVDLKELAAARGWNFRRGTTRRHWMLPHTYANLEIVSYTAHELDFPHEPHPLEHYVGPMVDPERGERLAPSDRKAWEEFVRNLDSRPLIYCSLGSHWDTDLRLLGFIVDVVARRPDWALVVGLGGKTSVERLGALPSNVLAMEWAPQVEVISRARVAITHGGISTINECVVNGVPMLVYSTGYVDQDGCATRIDYHGLGVAADRASATVEAIHQTLTELIGDETTRKRVAEMGREVSWYGDEGVAERLVDNALQRVGAGGVIPSGGASESGLAS